MKTLVLQTIRSMLRRISRSLLPNMGIHMPIKQLMKVCLEVGMEDTTNSLSEADSLTSRIQESFIKLIETLWEKLEEDPSQLSFFYEPPVLIKSSLFFTQIFFEFL